MSTPMGGAHGGGRAGQLLVAAPMRIEAALISSASTLKGTGAPRPCPGHAGCSSC